MRLFSILQGALDIQLTDDPEDGSVGLAFSESPADSSIVRLRITPPAGGENAIEIEFDRNGRERSRRLWPLKYPAWDSRSPEELDAVIAAAEIMREAGVQPEQEPVPEQPKAKGKK